MCYYIAEIKRVAKSKKIILSELAEMVGMTEQGFHQAARKKHLKSKFY